MVPSPLVAIAHSGSSLMLSITVSSLAGFCTTVCFVLAASIQMMQGSTVDQPADVYMYVIYIFINLDCKPHKSA